jgi:hypothetical protein
MDQGYTYFILWLAEIVFSWTLAFGNSIVSQTGS